MAVAAMQGADAALMRLWSSIRGAAEANSTCVNG